MKLPYNVLSAALLAGIMGCGNRSVDPSGIPGTEPSIRGEITAVTPASIRVEEEPGETSGSAKADIRLTVTTKVFRLDGSVTDATEFRTGQKVKVWFNGPVAESYPVQANAGVIVIESGDIIAVKERHEAGLMAIPGVAGVGIGQHDGHACIVVMVVKKTRRIDREVPDTLEGFPVRIEVTGPIVIR